MVTLYASWLAGKHPEWSFEAYQLVSGVADQYVPAALLHDALERGMRPE